MSESKHRLQRENDELRKTEALFETLLEAARKADVLLHGGKGIAIEQARDLLHEALEKMLPPKPQEPVVQIGRRMPRLSGLLATVGAAAAFGGGMHPEQYLNEHPQSGLPHRGRR